MKVKELIAHLQTFDQELVVAVPLWSEHTLLEQDAVAVGSGGIPRPDGWVHLPRNDKPIRQYLIIG